MLIEIVTETGWTGWTLNEKRSQVVYLRWDLACGRYFHEDGWVIWLRTHAATEPYPQPPAPRAA